MATMNPNQIRSLPGFSPEEIDPQVVVAAYLLHRMAALPKEAIGDLASLATELAECANEDELRGIVTTIKEILFPELLGEMMEENSEELNDENLSKYGKMVGETIRRLRIAKNWTQEVLAASADLSQEHVSRLETGTYSPSRKTIEKLAKALSVQVRDIDPTAD